MRNTWKISTDDREQGSIGNEEQNKLWPVGAKEYPGKLDLTNPLRWTKT